MSRAHTAHTPSGSAGRIVRAPLLTFGDEPHDGALVVTAEALRRIALVAAEAASRFDGPEAAALAMEWMAAPRPLFSGLSAFEACLDAAHCRMAVTLHGLEMDPEADANEVESVMALTNVDDDEEWPRRREVETRERDAPRKPRLFVAEVSHEEGGLGVWAFRATIADDEEEVLVDLEKRYGSEVAASAVVCSGFDRDVGMVRNLVSTALADTLSAVAEDPGSPIARGLDVLVEQRFGA